MKKLLLPILVISSLIFTGCIQDDPVPVILETGNTTNNYYNNDGTTGGTGGGTGTGATGDFIGVSGAITENTTWTSDNIYQLNQKVVVEDGVTLTIEPGTIIKGAPGTGSLASALIIARGGKINAVGTATKPIIFTASQDNIAVGETQGSNLDENDRALWGGVLLLGKARVSLQGDNVEGQIEGIPADDTFGLYGGTDDADNSGVMQYVSIRHGGALIGEGNEINGLTLGGVGSGTVIDHVEVVANLDDGIEFFGGTVSPTNVLIWATADDGLDIDQAYAGTIDNAMVIQGPASDHSFEIDGPEGSYNGSFTIQNVTLVGIGDLNTAGGEYADFRDAPRGTLSNVYAYGFKASSDIELDNNAVSQNFLDGIITFANWQVVGFDNNIFVEKVGCAQNCSDADESNDIPEDKIILNPTFTERAADWTTQVNEGEQTVGADTAKFSWTYAAAQSAF